MKYYARIEENVVMEVIEPAVMEDGTEVDINLRFTPEFVLTLVEVTDASPMPQCWWVAENSEGEWSFSPPSD